jgi:hypothetical protein
VALRDEGKTSLKVTILLTVLAVGLAACSNGEPLAACKGPVFQLNADHWQLAPGEAAQPAVANNQ